MKSSRLIKNRIIKRGIEPQSIFGFAAILIMILLPLKSFSQFICDTDMSQFQEETESCYLPTACSSSIPFSKYWNEFEGQIIIKVNFHFVKTGTTGINFSSIPDGNGLTGSIVAQKYVDDINNYYAQSMQNYT